MADISHHQFIALLKKSNVIVEKKLQPWLARVAKIESVRKLAKSLVEEELLTTWQAKFLLSGRHRLRIGNYFLLSRLHRDELGARYLAVHASLDRKVELQIFARDLISDTKRWKDMIQKATLVAKLDHSALVHVYDIDHDDDRYFLVVEHVQGRSLDVQKEIFTTSQIGQLILQCTEGIEVAHQNQVVHGTIDQSDVLLTEKGTIKLQNLTVSPMRNQQDDTPEAKPIADFIALASLGEKLLAANPGTGSGSGVGLAAIFALMKTEGASAIDKLKQWVEVTLSTEVYRFDATESGAKPIFSSTLESTSSFDLTKQDDVSYRPDVPDANESAVSSASIIKAAKASPAFLAACALGLVMFGGIVSFGLSRAYSKMALVPAAEVSAGEARRDLVDDAKAAKHKQKEQKAFNQWQAKQAEEGNANPSNGATEAKTTKKKQHRKNIKSPQKSDRQENPDDVQDGKVTQEEPRKDVERNTSVSDQVSSEESKSNLVEKPKEASNKFLDIFGKRNKDKGDTKDPKNNGAIVPAPAGVEPNNLQRLSGIRAAREKALHKAGVKTFAQIAKASPAALDKALQDNGTNKIGEKKWAEIIAAAKLLAEKSAQKAADHFRKVSSTFALPEIESTEPVKLTKLVIPSIYLLDIELISPDGVSPRKHYFELKKSVSNNQAWVVSSKKTKTNKQSNEIAEMKKLDDALTFAWLPSAAKDRSAVYLRNCLVRLSTQDGKSCVASLRKEQQVRSLRINDDDPIDTLSVAIEGVPHSDRLRVELVAINSRERLVELVNPTITPDSPGVINLKFRETSGQFLTLQVAVKRSGKSLKLTAGLVFDGGLIKNSKQLTAIKNRLDAIAASVLRQSSANPRDKELEKLKSAAERNVQRMDEYEKAITWLFEGDGGIGQAIDFEISADFDDAKTLLVRSVRSNKNEDKKNKKKKK